MIKTQPLKRTSMSTVRELMVRDGLTDPLSTHLVKPALAYLDVIRAAAEDFDLPIAAYNVSGEFSMIKAAAANGWIEEQRAALECLTAMRRAGAKLILTYWAKDAAKWLA